MADPVATTFHAAGPDGAPLIVLLHGARLSRAMWSLQVADLAGVYRVAAVDLPGHGMLADRPFTLDGAADHVAAVIRAESPDGRALVVGLSLGGYVAMHLAARHPAHVRGLVLSGCTAEPVAWRSIPYRGLAWAFEHVGTGALDRLNAWFFRARYPAAVAEPIVAGGFWYRGGAEALRSLVGQRFTERLASYDGPTLLLNGTYDVPFRLSARTFARAARRPSRARLRGATHLASLDRPEAFAAAVRRFAGRLDEAPPSGRAGVRW